MSVDVSRHHALDKVPQDSDVELYEKVFSSFGVSPAQFSYLMSRGVRCRAAPGGVVVRGGERFTKLAMIVTGEAVAHEFGPERPENGLGPPICKYVGKLGGAAGEGARHRHLPTRGSMIGGSALTDRQITEGFYPADVVAGTHLCWVEWELEQLERLIDAPRWRSVQACFYYMLYVDVIATLDRARAAKLQHREGQCKEEAVPAPSSLQLLRLSAFVAVPFCGFGFADNFIMIVAGDTIDAHFGSLLGLTTLAAAGLGNWMSDVVGLGLGDAIERACQRSGLSDGGLTPAQEKLRVAKLATLAAKIVGITAGCFLGMVPLLFLTPSKKSFAKEDLELYDEAFGPNGVSTQQFADLMERGTRHRAHAGMTIVHGGKPYSKVALLLRGELTAYPPAESGAQGPRPACVYVGRLSGEGPPAACGAGGDRMVPSRGSIIGGTAIALPEKLGSAYPNDVVASKTAEWIEWDLSELQSLMSEVKTIQGSFYSMLYHELISTLSKEASTKQLEKYQLLLSAVVSDGVVDEKEREFLDQHMEKLRVSEEEHFRLLADLGWTREDWERGSTTGPGQGRWGLLHGSSVHRRTATSSGESAAQLQRAVALIEGVVQSMRP